MAQPEFRDSLPYTDGDRKVFNKLVSLRAGVATYRTIGGDEPDCTWTRADWFGPSTTWERCGGTTGRNDYVKQGDIWPLQIGSSESYSIKSDNGISRRETVRRCEVTDALVVVISGKRLPTYEVVCTDSWSTRNWYVAPELGHVVKYTHYVNGRGLKDHFTVILEEG